MHSQDLLNRLYEAQQLFQENNIHSLEDLTNKIATVQGKTMEETILPTFTQLVPKELNSTCFPYSDICFSLVYKNGKLVKVYGATDTLACQDFPYTIDINSEEDTDKNNDTIKRKETIRFSVLFEDGTKIKESTAVATMIKALQHMSLERASQYKSTTFNGCPLVSKLPINHKNQHRLQKYVDGWWVWINMSNSIKKQCLKEVAKLLNISISIQDEETPTATENTATNLTTNKKTRYSLNGHGAYKKNRSVFAAVKLLVDEFPSATYEEILAQFPKHLQGSYGVIRKIEDIKERRKINQTEDERWFLDSSEILMSSDGIRFAVCSEWGKQHAEFCKYLENAFGWKLQEIIQDSPSDSETNLFGNLRF